MRALAAARPGLAARPLLVAERAAIDSLGGRIEPELVERIVWLATKPRREELEAMPAEALPAVDPVGARRAVAPGRSGPADAQGALAALDLAIDLALAGAVDAVVTAPVSKASIATHVAPGFVGHTDHLAARCGLERYGRDYLMTFLAPDLQVALATVHEPLTDALRRIEPGLLLEALACLDRHAGGRIAVAGMNPHAGEEGLLGSDETRRIAPAITRARAVGIDAHGPESADSLFARARRGEFDWVLALYHDQGLIAIKTASFGMATNWTIGLPFVRTSVDHGTAFELAGTGRADAGPLEKVLATTVELLDGRLPRRARRAD